MVTFFGLLGYNYYKIIRWGDFLKNPFRYILGTLGVLLAYTIGAWLYQKGSQVIFNQTISNDEYKGIVFSTFFLYLLILVPLIFLICYVIDLKVTQKTLKIFLNILGSILVGFIFPILVTGGRLTSPEGQLLMCLFFPPNISGRNTIQSTFFKCADTKKIFVGGITSFF